MNQTEHALTVLHTLELNHIKVNQMLTAKVTFVQIQMIRSRDTSTLLMVLANCALVVQFQVNQTQTMDSESHVFLDLELEQHALDAFNTLMHSEDARLVELTKLLTSQEMDVLSDQTASLTNTMTHATSVLHVLLELPMMPTKEDVCQPPQHPLLVVVIHSSLMVNVLDALMDKLVIMLREHARLQQETAMPMVKFNWDKVNAIIAHHAVLAKLSTLIPTLALSVSQLEPNADAMKNLISLLNNAESAEVVCLQTMLLVATNKVLANHSTEIVHPEAKQLCHKLNAMHVPIAQLVKFSINNDKDVKLK